MVIKSMCFSNWCFITDINNPKFSCTASAMLPDLENHPIVLNSTFWLQFFFVCAWRMEKFIGTSFKSALFR